MTIRARLTVWYAGLMFVSLLAMSALAYYLFVAEPRGRVSRGEEAKSDLADEQDDFVQIAHIVLWSGVPAALLALGGGWWLTRNALAPIAALTHAAEHLNEGSLRERLPRSGSGDELDRLTEVFNAMTARLDSSFQRVHEFTLHASHELKTPLTILRGEFETALQRDEDAPAQRSRLLSQLDEIDRLTKIVDGLTLLTKADAGQIALHREPLRLGELVRESFADAKILAQPASISVRLEPCEELTIQGDRHRLRQLLLNLTDNSIKYNHPNGATALSLQRVAGMAEFKISNTGAGLPLELQGRVFERFFRGDASHNRDIEGCGLGLSIAQWIVTAHYGAIHFASEPGRLTTVTVLLPLDSSVRL